MLTKYIYFENFSKKKNSKKIRENLRKLLDENNSVIGSLKASYKDNISKKLFGKLKKYRNIQLIGMGGSILGSKAIYNFLKHKIKKNFQFFDNLISTVPNSDNKKKLNLIVSKSGNTVETIINSNVLIKKTNTNIFLTGNRNSYLINLAKKLRSDVIFHNDFIGGRYSVLSEVGMLPAELMGFDKKKFRRFNSLIKNKNFLNSLVANVSNTIALSNQKKFNSIILNYDERSLDLFHWYQQLIAESLGKHKKGILPIISLLPRDNHSVMQLYLDGFRNNFFTFFYVKDEIKNKRYDTNFTSTKSKFIKKSLSEIREAKFFATKKVFKKKKIPFRSFYIKKRNEESLGELFTFFILETILLGMAMKVNPYNQPSVELIKKETKNYFK